MTGRAGDEWAQRWAALLAEAPGDIARRARQGFALVRSRRVNDVRVSTGRLSGSVQGSRATPYVAEIAVPVLGEGDWDRIAGTIASQVRHSARLLAGQAPEGLAAELEAMGVRLFPRREELEVACACGQGLCEHAAAVWYAAGEQLADDPFVLLSLRGRGRQRVLDDVAGRRGSVREGVDSGIALEALDVAGWWDARGPLDEVGAGPQGSLAAPRAPAPALRALGDPPGWAGGVSAYDLFRPLVERGAGCAARLLTEADDTDE